MSFYTTNISDIHTDGESVCIPQVRGGFTATTTAIPKNSLNVDIPVSHNEGQNYVP